MTVCEIFMREIEVERVKSRGEEEVSHELGFDSETGGAREAEDAGGTAGTEESEGTGDFEGFERELEKGVEEALEPAETRDKDGGEEKSFSEKVLAEGGLVLEVEEDTDGGNNQAPENARGEDGAERIRTPEGGQGEIEGEEVEEEVLTVGSFAEEVAEVEEKVFEREEREKGEPDEGKGEFVVGRRGGGEEKVGVVRKIEDERGGVEKKEAEFIEPVCICAFWGACEVGSGLLA